MLYYPSYHTRADRLALAICRNVWQNFKVLPLEVLLLLGYQRGQRECQEALEDLVDQVREEEKIKLPRCKQRMNNEGPS
jgi:hypothetical protein